MASHGVICSLVSVSHKQLYDNFEVFIDVVPVRKARNTLGFEMPKSKCTFCRGKYEVIWTPLFQVTLSNDTWKEGTCI